MRGRGRPPGSLGGGLLRRALRREAEAKAALEGAIVSVPQAGRPKLVPLEGEEEASLDTESGVVLASSSSFVSNLQLLVAMHAQSQSQLLASDDDNPAKHILASGRRRIMSERVADFSNKDLVLTASVLLEGSSFMWSTFLGRVDELLQSGWQGLMLAVSRRYDETPLTVRISEQQDVQANLVAVDSQDSQQPQQTCSKSSRKKMVTKIMQSELEVFAVLKHEPTGRCLQLGGKAGVECKSGLKQLELNLNLDLNQTR